MKQTCLMLGAGHGVPRRRVVSPMSAPEDQTVWKTLDINPAAKPDEVFDLENLEYGYSLPFKIETFDEIHAYEVLEHFGRQGNYKGLFSTFQALWKGLKPGGLLVGTCPSLQSPWLWAEPGHVRAIAQGTLAFLTRSHYDQLGETACSDYRAYVDHYWWEIEHSEDDGNNYVFVLRKSK